MKKQIITGLCLVTGLAIFPKSASADLLTFTGTGMNTGLSAADFTLLNDTTLKIVLANTFTSPPAYLSGDAASNQLLTSLAFRLGYGWDGTVQCCENTDLTHTFNDWISTLSAGTTQFKPGSLDGSALDGPSYGIAPILPFGSPLTSISNSATFTLSLSGGIPDLSFLADGAVVEFGSDAAFLTGTPGTAGQFGVPEPGAIALLGMGLLGWARHRRSTRRA